MVVIRFSAIRRSTRPASKVRSSTTQAPVHQASNAWIVQAPTWNCGSTDNTTSGRRNSSVRETDKLVQKQLAWLSTAARGRPIVPEV